MRQQHCRQWESSKNRAPTTWGADWDYFSTADCVIITLCPSPCCIQEVLIIITTLSKWEDIYFISVEDITITEIWKGTH